MTNKEISIPDVIGQIVSDMPAYVPDWLPDGSENKDKQTLADMLKVADASITGIYYEYGYPPEVAGLTSQKDQARSTWAKKYPAVFLFLPIRENKNTDTGILTTPNIRLAFVHQTKVDYTPRERYEKVIQPILVPMYSAFFDLVNKSRKFQRPYTGFEHRKTDRPYYDPDKKGNVANDFVDAIEVTNLDLTLLINNC